MVSDKLKHALRHPAVLMTLAVALIIAVVVSLPGVRSHISKKIDSGANRLLFDDHESGTESGTGAKSNDQKPSTLKSIVSAPVRLVAGIFRKKADDNDLAVKKSSDEDAEKMKIIPVSRSQDGIPGQGADANGAKADGKPGGTTAWALFSEGMELQEQGRTDAAIEKLLTATLLQPKLAEAFNVLAVCYDERRQYRNAQDAYQKALDVEPKNARFMNNLGYSYYLSADYDNAIKWYNKGLKISAKDRRLHNNLGLAYGRRGNYDKARKHFLIAVGEVGANLNLGYVCNQENKFDEAIRHYEAALKLEPQSLSALGNLAQLYERTGRPQEAAAFSEQYRKLALSTPQRDQAMGGER